MSFSRSLELSSPVDAAWAVLTDLSTVVSWISIIDDAHEHEHLSHYSAVLMDKVGPFRLRADLDIKLSDVEIARHVRVRAAGEDRQMSSRISVDVSLQLTSREPGSAVSVEGSYDVSGRVATIGAGMIRKKGEKIIEEFFHELGGKLG